MKLEVEPRVTAGPNFFASSIDWMRRAARAVNPLDEAIGPIRSGAKSISETLDAPAFQAYLSADQTITAGTVTFLHCDVEEFDTNGRYNTATWAFTPNVAGYYVFYANMCATVTAGTMNDLRMQFWKNGTNVRQPVLFQGSAGAVGNWFGGSGPIFMNGTTDAMQAVGLINGTGLGTPKYLSGGQLTSFGGHLVRRA
jgi:hypothetical protein